MVTDQEWRTMLKSYDALAKALCCLLDELPLTERNMALREAAVCARRGIEFSRTAHGISRD